MRFYLGNIYSCNPSVQKDIFTLILTCLVEHRLLGVPREEMRTSEQFVRELTRLSSLIYLHRVSSRWHRS